MDSTTERATIIRALLALATAVIKIENALSKVAPTEDKEYSENLEALGKDRNRFLEQVQKLVNLMETHHE